MRKENIEDIEKMDYKELRKTVRLLYDEVTVFRRNYEDAINNLDSDNFGKSFTAEQNGMKTQIKITADGLKSTVSKTDLAIELIGYSTVEETLEITTAAFSQLHDELSLVVTTSDGKSVINSASIIAAINNDTSVVTIAADKIDLTGVVTVSDLSTKGKVTIHGGNIKANTLSVDMIKRNKMGYIAFDCGIEIVDGLYFKNGACILEADDGTMIGFNGDGSFAF